MEPMEIADAEARVLSVKGEPLPYYTLRLGLNRPLSVSPGQFVMVQTDPRDPYLRRPFSVFDLTSGPAGALDEARIELLGKVIGPGTQRLALARPDEPMRVLGPLGRGFDIALGDTGAGGAVAVVAGGVGSAGLLLLSRALVARGTRFDFFYGGRAARDLACSERFRALAERSGGELVPVTEDGSAGRRGLVTGPLEEGLAQGGYTAVFTCGPMAMMRRVAELALRYGVPGQAALETPMGCGYGACIGCAVPHRSGRYALCCKEGPVFDFDEVEWTKTIH